MVIGVLLEVGEVATEGKGVAVAEVGEAAVGNLEGAAVVVGVEVGEVDVTGGFFEVEGVAATTGGCLATDGVLEEGEVAVGNVEGAVGVVVGNVEGATGFVIGNVEGATGFVVGNVEGAFGVVVGKVEGAFGVVVGKLEGAERVEGCQLEGVPAGAWALIVASG